MGRGRPVKVNLSVADNFIQPQLLNILEDVGFDFGLNQKEAIHLYKTYYKEFILKEMIKGDFTHLKILGIGNIVPSYNKSKSFQKGKYNTEKYEDIINKLVENSKLPTKKS